MSRCVKLRSVQKVRSIRYIFENTQNILCLKYKTAYIQESASVKYVTIYINIPGKHVYIIPLCIFKFHIFLCVYLCASYQFWYKHLITKEPALSL